MAVRRCPHQKNVTIFHTRPGRPVHLAAIRPAPGAPQDPPLGRPHGSVLGQRLGRIIQRHPEERTRPPHGAPHTRKGHQLLLPRGSRPTLQSHATPLNARLPHPQRGRTRAEKPQTRSLRPPKTTVRETPSTPITADRRQRVRGKGDDHPAQEAPPTANSTRRRRRRTGASTGSAGPKERTIAHIKSWRILHTPYRRPLETFEQTITAALALYSFKTTP